MFKKVLSNIDEKCKNTCNDDYVKDGLIYCGKCHTPKQCRVKSLLMDSLVYCMCQCEQEKYEKERSYLKNHENELLVDRLRKNGIFDKEMHSWNFENDNGSNPALIKKAKLYVNNWEEMKSKNIGLCLFGNVGTGKTYTAACIANALIDRGIRVIMTDFSRIINDMQSFDTGNKNAYIDDICNSSLLILDDLGAERQSDFALQIVEQVIDKRYKAKKPLILTTNISLEKIKNPDDTKYCRIYSRILGMTVPIQVDGQDNRKNTHVEKLEWAKQLFSG